MVGLAIARLRHQAQKKVTASLFPGTPFLFGGRRGRPYPSHSSVCGWNWDQANQKAS